MNCLQASAFSVLAPDSNTLAPSVVITVGGEPIGIVGATTPLLPSVSFPGENMTVNPADPDDLTALVGIIQGEVDALEAEGINKIILVSHLQQFAIEQSLAGMLSGVDIIVAGGSDRLLADGTDRLRAGHERAGYYPVNEIDADGNAAALVSSAG